MSKVIQFYQTTLKNIKNELIYKKSLEDLNNSKYSIMDEKDGVKLFLYLDDTLKVKNALFSYLKNDYLSLLMEVTCHVIIGLPIKEVREHGVIRIENFLNPKLKKTVQGVALPTNYSIDFIWLNKFLINICDRIIKESKIKNKINFYYPRPTKSWKEKTDEQKKEILNHYIRTLKSSTNIKSDDVKITIIANDHLFIEFLNSFNPNDKSVYCMELEKIVRKDLDFLIIYMKRAQDVSSLRRKLDLK